MSAKRWGDIIFHTTINKQSNYEVRTICRFARKKKWSKLVQSQHRNVNWQTHLNMAWMDDVNWTNHWWVIGQPSIVCERVIFSASIVWRNCGQRISMMSFDAISCHAIWSYRQIRLLVGIFFLRFLSLCFRLHVHMSHAWCSRRIFAFKQKTQSDNESTWANIGRAANERRTEEEREPITSKTGSVVCARERCSRFPCGCAFNNSIMQSSNRVHRNKWRFLC